MVTVGEGCQVVTAAAGAAPSQATSVRRRCHGARGAEHGRRLDLLLWAHILPASAYGPSQGQPTLPLSTPNNLSGGSASWDKSLWP